MPIGVPRIIYCWGEELPAQWTDIYNFIFRRRMIFLMQYLDDELCNQICGLLINIHMEDRSKELEKKEMEKSGLFKSGTKQSLKKEPKKLNPSNTNINTNLNQPLNNNNIIHQTRSIDDLLISEEDLAIDENDTVEQYTLQKITLEWLTWNAQFFDYSDEPYLFYLSEILSKDFKQEDASLFYNANNQEMATLMKMLRNMTQKSGFNQTFRGTNFPLPQILNDVGLNSNSPLNTSRRPSADLFGQYPTQENRDQNTNFKKVTSTLLNKKKELHSSINSVSTQKQHLDVYSPFRLIANFVSDNYSLKNINQTNPQKLAAFLQSYSNIIPEAKNRTKLEPFQADSNLHNDWSKSKLKLIKKLANKELINNATNPNKNLAHKEKALGQRQLKRAYLNDLFNCNESNDSLEISNQFLNLNKGKKKYVQRAGQSTLGWDKKALNYLNLNSFSNNTLDTSLTASNNREYREYYRKQTERTLQEEEAKKVFVIINSFGGSVGNGITVHDALQFIKAGSLTLGLGVAASAASLVLAGGTIGERYVTEGCHVMIHQPEGGLNGQASDISIDAQEIKKIRVEVAKIYSLSTYRPQHQILHDLDRDFYLTAIETVSYGLADEIATNEVMHDIIEMTSKAWDYDDSKQQRLLEIRENLGAQSDTLTQN